MAQTPESSFKPATRQEEQHRGPLQPSVHLPLNSSSTNSVQPGRLPGACGAEWQIWAAPHGAGSSSSRGILPRLPQGPQGQGQHAGPGATGSVGGQAVANGVTGGSATTGAASSSGMHPPDCRLHQHQLPPHQNGQPPLPPPPLPPPPQQTTSHATRMAPNSERRYAPKRTSEPAAPQCLAKSYGVTSLL